MFFTVQMYIKILQEFDRDRINYTLNLKDSYKTGLLYIKVLKEFGSDRFYCTYQAWLYCCLKEAHLYKHLDNNKHALIQISEIILRDALLLHMLKNIGKTNTHTKRQLHLANVPCHRKTNRLI